ncbi:MAG: hypothetical protein ABL932_17810, partial [Terricaulis sp.]
MGQEERLLSLSIADTLADANRSEGSVAALVGEDGMAEEYWEVEQSLQWALEKAFRDLRILAERLHLPRLRGEIVQYCSRVKKLTDMEPYPIDEPGFYCPALRQAHLFFDSMSVMITGTKMSGLEVFRTILRNSGAIIAARGLEPKNEKEVEKAIFEVVSFCFHDAVSQMVIPQLVKSYKPEFGVKSLMAAAEYKFATTEQEVKTALDGFYTDMRGYHGSHEWRTFFAVLYTTAPLLHP